MSLDGIVEQEQQKTRVEIIKEYVHLLGKAAYHGVVEPAFWATRLRMQKEREQRQQRALDGHKKAQHKTFSWAEVGIISTYINTGLLLLGVAAADYHIAVGLLATNGISATYETLRHFSVRNKQKKEEENDNRERYHAKSWQDRFKGVVTHIYSEANRFSKTLRQLNEKKKEHVTQFLRRTASGAKTLSKVYALTTALAVGHYTVSSQLPEDRTFREHDITVQLEKCSYVHKGYEHQLYVLAEEHLYNKSTAYVVQEFFKNYPFDLVLREGIGGIDQKYDNVPSSWQIIELAQFIFSKAAGKDQPTASHFAVKYQKKIIPLEDVNDDTGYQVGISGTEIKLLTGVHLGILLIAPCVYFFLLPQRYFSDRNSLSQIGLSFYETRNYNDKQDSPLLTKRNMHMAEHIIEYVDTHKQDVPLIRFGGAHRLGIKYELSRYGTLACQKIQPSEIIKRDLPRK